MPHLLFRPPEGGGRQRQGLGGGAPDLALARMQFAMDNCHVR